MSEFDWGRATNTTQFQVVGKNICSEQKKNISEKEARSVEIKLKKKKKNLQAVKFRLLFIYLEQCVFETCKFLQVSRACLFTTDLSKQMQNL